MVKRPNDESLVDCFGTGYFRTSVLPQLQSLWNEQRSHHEALYQEWSKYLTPICGDSVQSEGLFLRHTYLASLTKLMVYLALSAGNSRNPVLLQAVLDSSAFREWGLANFMEGDFFSWLGRHQQGIALARDLLQRLSQFDIAQMEDDALQDIYQDLLDMEERCKLEEYYTPGQIAQHVTSSLLHDAPEKRLLDPACGSGVFLTAAIRYKLRYLSLAGGRLLRHVLGSVVGIDIHPVAVIMAKANYLIALRPLLRAGSGTLSIPVYMADSLEPPQEIVFEGVRAYEKIVDQETVLYIPVLDDPGTIDEIVDALRNYAVALTQDLAPKPDMRTYLEAMPRVSCLLESGEVPQGLFSMLQHTGQSLARLIKNHRGQDSTWPFVLKNFYKPAVLLHSFDVVIGVSEVPPMNFQG
jgi:hypothetical protein